MDDISDAYALETVDQMRVIADELRQRIHDALAARPMTVTQLGELLNIAPARVHYHVRELERVGLVRLVQTREKGSILEKYYRSVARYLSIPPSLLRSLTSDEEMAAAQGVLDDITRGMMAAVTLPGSADREQRGVSLGRWYRWMTPDEVARLIDQIQTILAQYDTPRGVEGEEERVIVLGTYHPEPEGKEESRPQKGEAPARTRRDRTVVLGSVSFGRADLERALDRGAVLDVTAFGHVRFANDITPELAHRAIGRFHHRGKLTASPEVREVLRQKSGSQ